MPLFIYRCPTCKVTLEYLESQPTPYPDRRCPACQTVVFRVPSASSFIVKGFSAKNGYSK